MSQNFKSRSKIEYSAFSKKPSICTCIRTVALLISPSMDFLLHISNCRALLLKKVALIEGIIYLLQVIFAMINGEAAVAGMHKTWNQFKHNRRIPSPFTYYSKNLTNASINVFQQPAGASVIVAEIHSFFAPASWDAVYRNRWRNEILNWSILTVSHVFFYCLTSFTDSKKAQTALYFFTRSTVL